MTSYSEWLKGEEGVVFVFPRWFVVGMIAIILIAVIIGTCIFHQMELLNDQLMQENQLLRGRNPRSIISEPGAARGSRVPENYDGRSIPNYRIDKL